MKKIFLFLAFLLGCLPAIAQIPQDGVFGFCGDMGDNLFWELTPDGTLTLSGSGKMGDYEVGLFNAPWWDYRKDIRSVIFPEGLTAIGDYAFYECSVLTGPLTFPEGLISIGAYAFFKCSALTGVSFPEKLTSIGDAAFLLCYSLTGPLILPQGLSYLGRSAFKDCWGLSGSLTLPSGLTRILASTFEDCWGFTGPLTLPAGLTTIEGGAFKNCKRLTGSLFLPKNLTSIEDFAFSDCRGLTSLTLQERLVAIGNCAFMDCSGLTEVTNISPTPQVINSNVFKDVPIQNIPLIVFNHDAAALYREANVWKDFQSVSVMGQGDESAFTVTVRANNPEFGSVSGGGRYETGATATLSASAKDDFIFYKWNDGNKENPRTITVLKDATFTAIFAPDLKDTVYVEVPVHDTLYIHDTVWNTDTVTIIVYDTVFVEIEPGTQNESKSVPGVNLYPNPSSGTFTVELQEEALIEIFTAGGTKLFSQLKLAGKNSVNLSGSGIYLLKITAGGRTATRKIIIK